MSSLHYLHHVHTTYLAMIMLFLPTSAYSTAGRCQDLFKGSGLSNIWTFPNQIALVKFKNFEEGSDRAAPLESHGLRVEYSYASN